VEPETGRPRLRGLEIVPTEQEGQRALILRDPLRLSEATLIVPMGLVPILQRMDGTRTPEDIRRECIQELGAEIPEDIVPEVITHMENAHFLEGEDFDAWREGTVRAYLDSPTRPSFLAGKSYEADADALRSRIEGFFTEEGGPGLPAANGNHSGKSLRDGRALKGLIAPHIDFGRGGATFACSYRAVAECADADVFVVLGTVHAATEGIFSLTRKGFETPLGLMEVDDAFVDGLASRAPEDLFRDEFAQRGEHSIEFQAVFLRYTYPAPNRVKFVPVLVGSFAEFVAQGRSPKGDERVEGFIEALKGTAAELEAGGRKVCIVASVDLAHAGPQFGADRPVDEAQLRALDEADRASLDAVCRGDAEDFYWSVATDGDARNVCGLAPIYTMLRAMEGCRGELLRYSQWPDPNGTVTFCSVALH
jgi:AmmeMemoRadiSam system protein B